MPCLPKPSPRTIGNPKPSIPPIQPLICRRHTHDAFKRNTHTLLHGLQYSSAPRAHKSLSPAGIGFKCLPIFCAYSACCFKRSQMKKTHRQAEKQRTDEEQGPMFPWLGLHPLIANAYIPSSGMGIHSSHS